MTLITRLLTQIHRPSVVYFAAFFLIVALRFLTLTVIYNMPVEQMQYSEKYFDDFYEYRHVILPPDLASLVPRNHLMTETEWRNLGVQQSPNWVHYMIHNPEPHVLLFRRPKPPDEPTESLNEVDSHPNTITAV